ncbi:hypothetical protein I6N95_15500 [Vagococcus sp. BWB3-3]|uniref:Uncharacterized protein n=1 Tax=Vagococcus allomyrinae TaxID=2794353 RepID=A0A940P6B2_9ENTE|nr:hypothetical protein [Vagococcus allomyrinae]MBP1042424.1 hypothetical protein [Vagococcus allomyrinae]
MPRTKSLFSEYNVYSLENLLREYLTNSQNEELSNEVVQVVKSAEMFQKGQYEKNNYIAPSKAYSFSVHALNLMTGTLSIEDIQQSISKGENSRITDEFIKNLLTIIGESLSTENSADNQLVFWG